MSHHPASLTSYFTVITVLVVLTFLTWTVAESPLGVWHTPAALAIAVTKATLVVLFFMHVWGSSGLTKLVILTAVFFLSIMFVLTLSDYLTRGWLPGLTH